jgi:hypothetical protein
MNNHYRKPSVHVAGITSILLKGSVGLLSDWSFGRTMI